MTEAVVIKTPTLTINGDPERAPRVLTRRYHDGIANARRQGRLRGRKGRRR